MLEFGIKDAIDIILVAIILYSSYKVMKQSRSVNIFYGVLIFVSFWIVVSKVLEMKVLGSILDQLVGVGAIALIILFQEEIRHFFFTIGTHEKVHRLLRPFRNNDRHLLENGMRHDREAIFPIVMACINMSRQRVGALIVIERDMPLTAVANTGEVIDACITQRLIENIFFKNSPLHDGAMIIANKRIHAAGCILPVAHDNDIPKSLGLRHRAALGISQKADCLCIIVSEETGAISLALNSHFTLRLSAEELERRLTDLLVEEK